jgi:hypothetical protein
MQLNTYRRTSHNDKTIISGMYNVPLRSWLDHFNFDLYISLAVSWL